MLEFKKEQLRVLKEGIKESISNNEELCGYAKEFMDIVQEIIEDADTYHLATTNLYRYGQLNKLEDKIVKNLIIEVEDAKIVKEVSDLMIHITTKVHFIILLQEDCCVLETMLNKII